MKLTCNDQYNFKLCGNDNFDAVNILCNVKYPIINNCITIDIG